MNIVSELKPKDNKYDLFINGAEIGLFTVLQLKNLIKKLDHLIHHKNNIKKIHKDYHKIDIRKIDLGHWEVSQVRKLIEDIDTVI